MGKTKFQIGAEVQLFKTDLVCMTDTVNGKTIIRQPKAGADAQGISLDEFIEEITGVFNKLGIDDIAIPKPEPVKQITQGINIYLKEIFMLIENEKNEKKEKKKSIDFALWISMDTSEKLQDMFPITIKSGYLKVWNTDMDTIKNEMDIGAIEKLLEPAPEEPKPAKK